MILKKISNDAVFVKVSSSTISAERFLKGEYGTLDVLLVPDPLEPSIRKVEDTQVLHHFLSLGNDQYGKGDLQ